MEALTFIVIISVLGPIIGSFLGVVKKTDDKFVFNMLAFAAGIMLTISFMELIPEAIQLSSAPMAALGVLIGALSMFILDKSIPHFHPSPKKIDTCHCPDDDCKSLHASTKLNKLEESAKYLVAGIFLHNFPEGMAIATMSDPKVGFAVAAAIAIHNIPEGICTSAPLYHATKKEMESVLNFIIDSLARLVRISIRTIFSTEHHTIRHRNYCCCYCWLNDLYLC
jgi:ZIP family zinc transporter